jgi:integrase
MASIQKRGENSFLLVVESGYDPAGRRIRRTKTVRIHDQALLKTTKRLKDHLQSELIKFKLEVESGAYISPDKMKLEQFIKEWETKFAIKNLGEKTLYEQISLAKNHIIPSIGHLRLDQIKPIHIINHLDNLSTIDSRKDGKPGALSDSTLYQIDKVLRSIFNRAEEWQVIKESPMKKIKRPRIKKKEMNYLDEQESVRLIDSLQKINHTWRLYFLTAMIGGLRRGEIISLEWPDLDFENNLIHVNKNIPMFKNKQPVIKDTKSGSTRFVSMPSWYMADLKEYHHVWKKDKLAMGELWEGGDRQFVFHGGVGIPFYPQTATGEWQKFKKKFGFEGIRLHDLRHTMITLLIEEGVNIKAIQERAGHSSSRITTDVYGHITKKVRDMTAEKFEKFKPSTIRQQAEN